MAHWYLPDGELKQYVPNASKPGELRPYTLRDARKDRARPSTTTKLNILSDYILDEFRYNDAIRLAISETLENIGLYEPEDLFVNIKRKLETHMSWAANFGTRVHKVISSLNGGEPYSEPELDELDLLISGNRVLLAQSMAEAKDFTKVNEVGLATKDWMDSNGFKCRDTELTFVSDITGSAGTVDWIGWHYDKPCVVDIKTQDAESTKDFKYWPKVGYQLADYVMGLNSSNYFDRMVEEAGVFDTETHWTNLPHYEDEDIERISIYTSRTNPGVVFPYQWVDVNDFKKMTMISEFWFLDKKYDPRVKDEAVQEGLI